MPTTKVVEVIVRLVGGAAMVGVMNAKEDLIGTDLHDEKDPLDKRILLEVEMRNDPLVMVRQTVADVIHVSDSMTSLYLN